MTALRNVPLAETSGAEWDRWSGIDVTPPTEGSK